MTEQTQPTDAELLPCPFCGANASGYEIAPHSHSGPLKAHGIPDHGGSYVIEGDCNCGSGLIGATQDEVTARWNRRWGTPAGAGEPVGEVESSLRFTGGFHVRLYRDAHMPEPGTKLYTTPQPTQAQAGAVPLTDEQCEISSQGPRMSHALSETHGDLCIVYVDFSSKRFNVSGAGSADEVPSVSIDPCDQLQGWECADVVFPNRRGWDVVSASSSKYTLTTVLKRKGADHG